MSGFDSRQGYYGAEDYWYGHRPFKLVLVGSIPISATIASSLFFPPQARPCHFSSCISVCLDFSSRRGDSIVQVR